MPQKIKIHFIPHTLIITDLWLDETWYHVKETTLESKGLVQEYTAKLEDTTQEVLRWDRTYIDFADSLYPDIHEKWIQEMHTKDSKIRKAIIKEDQ